MSIFSCPKPVLVAAAGLALAPSAFAATVTDTFDYPNQAAFEAAYTITTEGTATATLNTVNSSVDFSGTGANSLVRITSNAGAFQLDADSAVTVSGTFSGANFFARERLGLNSVSNPANDRVFLQIDGSNSGDRARLIVGNDGAFTTVADTFLPTNDRAGDFALLIDSNGALTVTRNGVAPTTTTPGALTNVASGIDFSDYAAGGNAYVGLSVGSPAGVRSFTLDNLSITGDPIGVIPEPASLALLGLGGVALLGRRR